MAKSKPSSLSITLSETFLAIILGSGIFYAGYRVAQSQSQSQYQSQSQSQINSCSFSK